MLQLIYISTAVPGPRIDTDAILAVSRSNNGRDGITGLLYTDHTRFLQALEGPEEKVEAALERIRHDVRHRAIVILSRREIAAREFGECAMAHQAAGASNAAFIDQVRTLVANASANVRATFEGFVQLRQAA
jgi:hypothetical protein